MENRRDYEKDFRQSLEIETSFEVLWWPVDLTDEMFVTFVEENALVVVDFCVP